MVRAVLVLMVGLVLALTAPLHAQAPVRPVRLEARWSVTSTPAAGSQASAARAAAAGRRHVVECVTVSAGSTLAPVLTALTVNLRDGASGAGAVLWTVQVVIPAATGQNVAPFTVCGLELPGTANTAITLEFSAALANLIQSVTLTGYDVIS